MAYFVGVGGIGMSALARYMNFNGIKVAGYDLTRTPLTEKLAEEGIVISFTDDENTIPSVFKEDDSAVKALVVYTPAIPSKNRLLQYFRGMGFTVIKRSKLLGELVNEGRCIAVAGTHGKTSVCSLTAHLLMKSDVGCNAFLGGVARNYGSNMLVTEGSDLFVVEADEYDRSFLQLKPDIAVITSMDPDHLDIYGSFSNMASGFSAFAGQVKRGGTIICKYGLSFESAVGEEVSVLYYGMNEGAGYHAANVRLSADGLPLFDLITPGSIYKDLRLGIPGRFNVENAVAAIAAAIICGLPEKEIRSGIESFSGIHRRFDVRINMPGCVLIDDYAHHPAELKACISAAREIFPGRKITGIFQPHLFSRTRDFADQFAESLESLDELVLLDIYPAREEPLPGVTSGLILDRVRLKNKILCSREKLPGIIAGLQTDVVITLGAGNIDAMVEPVGNILLNKTGEL